MRIAIVTEGVSEYKSLPELYEQLRARTKHTLLNPLKVNVSPDAPVAVVARECKSRVLIASQNADLVVILLDREQQPDCPGVIAGSIAGALGQVCAVSASVKVVLKDRAYENWLVADLDALRAQPKRFQVTSGIERAVQPNKADRCDALRLLSTAALGPAFDKVQDSVRICRRMDVHKAAQHSRSLRHLLHVLGDEDYPDQCRTAA